MVTLVVRFNLQDGKLEEFKGHAGEMIKRTKDEAGCLFYSFNYSTDGKKATCLESYKSAKDLLTHIGNVTEGGDESPLTKAQALIENLHVDCYCNSEAWEVLREPIK